jgi:N-acetylglucosaminyldiphosphoundecaprenol N-acetyl-beta-D-mannosaminyltransferase
MSEVVSYLEHTLQTGNSKAVFTANVDHVVRFSQDSAFRKTYESADLALIDGTPLLWAARLLGVNVRTRVAGIDLFVALCQLAQKRGYRCFFLGSREATLNKACVALQRQMPGLQIAGSHHGYFEDSRPVLEALRNAQPHFLFIGMGSPRQEAWVAQHRSQLSGVIMPVGGSFEVVAGEKKRAPRWAQRMGMEWIWRLMQDPRRLWKRYLVDDMVFLKLFYRELRNRLPGK